MEIQVGSVYSVTVTVDETNTASALGSGLVDVFATPMMVALIENAAAQCIAPFLEEGMASVGTHVNVSHDAATPMGMRVTATATVTEVDRKRVEFEVEARDEAGLIGKGTHTRFLINVQNFMARTQGKLDNR